MNELEEIEEIINKLDELSLDVWTKKDNETEEEFEKRIENLEEELEEELIDVISDSIVNEQKINEDEAIKEAKEKIEKEYEIYKDAFEQDGNGKIKLKSRDELEKLDYKSNEEIEKLNAIAKNYNDPDSYIDEIKNSINEKKDVDAEIERKLEIAKAYISAKIRGEEAVVSTNDIKSKKYEDNNDYIKKSNQLNRIPLVQNEMIFNNKLISQSYVPFVPNTNYNVIQTNNAQTGTVLINKPQNTITNPTKIQVLKNIENKMDNSNDLTKQKIKARAELKIIFKEIEGKELTEAENNDLKQKIKEVEKKYPNTVTDKTITKLCDNFKVKLPEENIQNMPNQVVTQSTENNEGNKETEDSNLKSNEENMQSAKQNLQKINNDINQKTNQVNKSQVKRTGRSKEEKEKIIDEIFSDIFIQENSNDIDLTRIQGSDVPFISSYLLEYKNPKIQSKFDSILKKFDEFTDENYIDNLNNLDGYLDIKSLYQIYKLYSLGKKSNDGKNILIDIDKEKANKYLNAIFIYVNFLREKTNEKNCTAIEKIKNEARFCNILDFLTLNKDLPILNLMIQIEKTKRYNINFNRENLKEQLVKFDEKIKNNEKINLYNLEILGDIYYNGIKSTNGDVIMKPSKIRSMEIYEKILLDYPNSENAKTYNRLYNLYNDNTLPIYDKEKAEKIRNIMIQKNIKIENTNTSKEEIKSSKPCTYICSDLHGEYNAYKTIINRLGENDKLYILGDVIDRGEDGIKILQDIINRQEKGQVEFFMGNHELMMLQTLLGNEESKELWLEGNGGEATYRDYKKLPLEEQIKIKDFLLNTNIYKQINENNQDYYLVHAKAIQDEEKKSQTYKEMIEQGLESKIKEALWTRVGTHEGDCKDYEIAKKDVFTIIGHTPVNNSLINFKQGYVDIDCGISYDEQVALVNLTDGTVEYFSGESIKEKSKEKENNNEER